MIVPPDPARSDLTQSVRLSLNLAAKKNVGLVHRFDGPGTGLIGSAFALQSARSEVLRGNRRDFLGRDFSLTAAGLKCALLNGLALEVIPLN